MSKPKSILDNQQIQIIINRLCQQLVENHDDFSNTILIGLQPRGVQLCQRIKTCLESINSKFELQIGSLDITFYRDDFRRREDPLIASSTSLDVSLESKKVVVIDDVLYTGRSVRASLDALLDYGRPVSIELLVLIDRRLSRHVPIQPDYVGCTIDVVADERVSVEWGDNERVILKSE
ncbi:MAG TPA: bifunctional pyr operon transcriptional regulator/uracil phosphoribosyltransferase PyrR [Flavobacteriales bacterium]|nr:bifunctional pyr operon transcriptional regulator/uracil phosphoribosyltransferase PyrR [Flavobacteriales bacterium]|tara:strand:+ start:533 stop:1066 length:534 start_codon:yes stop_codon:yes gene_type:complete